MISASGCDSLDCATIFAEKGDYVLTIKVAGDGAETKTVNVQFNWTGNWQTSFLQLDTSTAQPSGKTLRPIEIRDVLDDLIRQGELLLPQWNSSNDALLTSEIRDQSLRWLAAVGEFVRDNLDVAHVDKLKDYKGTVEAKHRWTFSFNLAKSGLSPQDYPIPFELGYKIQILKYFREEIR